MTDGRTPFGKPWVIDVSGKRIVTASLTVMVVGLVALSTVAATGGPDPVVSPPAVPGPALTCHSASISTCEGTAGVLSFHNDELLDATFWVRLGDLSGPVVYWQCVSAGKYTGDPSSGPSQGGFAGSPVPLSDFDTEAGEIYSIQAFRSCWTPCEPDSVNCEVTNVFLIGQHENCIEGA